jgi:hypothetical protein
MDSAPRGWTAGQRAAAERLADDLRRVFGARLSSVVAYGLVRSAVVADEPLHTLALVEHLTFNDLAACAPAVEGWRRMGLAVPLLLGRGEFVRSLDVFPLEYGDIIAHHIVVTGEDPFTGVQVAEADLRRACELQAKSHLIHLREGFLETGRHARRVSRMIAHSAPAFRALLVNISRLDGASERAWAGELSDAEIAARAEQTTGVPASVVSEVLALERAPSVIADPSALLARYVSAAERIWAYVDAWRG